MRSCASLIACLVVLASLAFAAEVAKIATSSIIASAGSVNLYSGNADVAASGERPLCLNEAMQSPSVESPVELTNVAA